MSILEYIERLERDGCPEQLAQFDDDLRSLTAKLEQAQSPCVHARERKNK